MNKFIATIVILSLASIVQAQTTNTPPVRGGFMRESNIKPKQIITPAKLQTFKVGSSTRPVMGTTTRNMMGSTTKGMKQEKRELKMTEKKDVALNIKNKLVERLTQALNSLTTTKTNLSTYIDKQIADGKSVGNAKTLLTTASTKIETARKAVATVVAWKPDAKTASSTEISLTKPRETANIAIKAVQEARLAIHEVIKELRAKKTDIKKILIPSSFSFSIPSPLGTVFGLRGVEKR